MVHRSAAQRPERGEVGFAVICHRFCWVGVFLPGNLFVFGVGQIGRERKWVVADLLPSFNHALLLELQGCVRYQAFAGATPRVREILGLLGSSQSGNTGQGGTWIKGSPPPLPNAAYTLLF